MSRAAKLRSILVLMQRMGAERHVLGEDVARAQEAGESVFDTDEELAILAEINGRLGSELNVYAGILTHLVGTLDTITDEKTQVLYLAQQRAGECQCHPCRVRRQGKAQ